ncbi:MAG TPA: hypothetical protein VH761_13020 [Ilumatobacteraceae bacterium]
MRTRTLLLLAIVCGLAILIAGGIQLLRLGNQESSSTLLAMGQPGKAGDVTVTLISSSVPSTDRSTLVTTVTLGGADDADGLDGFTLVGPGKVASVTSSTCAGITIAPVECELTFATDDMQGTSRQLIFRRADEQLRWVLAADK